jgi:hypothetical protein
MIMGMEFKITFSITRASNFRSTGRPPAAERISCCADWPHSIDTMKWMIPWVDRSSPVPNQCHVFFAVITVLRETRRALTDHVDTIFLSISDTIFYLLVRGDGREMGV